MLHLRNYGGFNMRDFIATPFMLLTQVFGYITSFILGKTMVLMVIEYEDEDEDQ